MKTDTGLQVDVAQIREGKGNPRRRFDEAGLKELAQSLTNHGVLQPLLVRPAENGSYHLVCGARRLRAAKLAGLASVPVTVRELTDDQVLEIQVVENLQREDLHFLDEAEGYQSLLKIGNSAEELAAKVGKSKAYIYARIKLCRLPDVVKKLCLDGKLEASMALLIARVPDPKAATSIGKQAVDHEMSYRRLRDEIQRTCMHELKNAPFDVKNASLVPAAGACAACPKRTGNQPELFSDCAADVCTDPKCYQEKVDATWASVKAEAKERGDKVVEGAKADEIRYRFHSLVSLKDTSPIGKAWSAITKGGEGLQKVIARDQWGDVAIYVDRKEASEAARALGFKISAASEHSRPRSAHEAAQAFKARVRAKVIELAMPQVVERAEKKIDERTLLRYVISDLMGGGSSDAVRRLMKRRDVQLKTKSYSSDADAKLRRVFLEPLTVAQLRGVIVELIAGNNASANYNDSYGGAFRKACEITKVDLTSLHVKVQRELRKQPTKARKSSPAKPKRGKDGVRPKTQKKKARARARG